jgi:hypothetical protein
LVFTAVDLGSGASAEDFGKYFVDLSSDITVEVRKSEAPGASLWQLSGSVGPARHGHSGVAQIPLGVPSSVARFFALVRLVTPWLGPRQGKELTLDKDSILCSFLRTDGVHVVLLGVSGIDDVLTTFESGSNGSVVIKSRNDNATSARFQVLAAAADEFEVAMSALIYEARKLVRPYEVATKHDPKAEWLSSWYDGLTYCTWNGIGPDLTEEKILSALDELKAHGIKISGLIIDDNWQALDNEGGGGWERGWKQFEANPKAFPNGLAKTVTAIRERHHNIEHVAVWHALLGYWGGSQSTQMISSGSTMTFTNFSGPPGLPASKQTRNLSWTSSGTLKTGRDSRTPTKTPGQFHRCDTLDQRSFRACLNCLR